jgi:hypothetical protein
MRTGSSGTQRVTTVHTCLVDHAGLYDGGEHHGLLPAGALRVGRPADAAPDEDTDRLGGVTITAGAYCTYRGRAKTWR